MSATGTSLITRSLDCVLLHFSVSWKNEFSPVAIAIIIIDQAGHVIYGLSKRIRYLSVLACEAKVMVDGIKLVVCLEQLSLVCDTDSHILYSAIQDPPRPEP